jgi:hypothetical protein
MRYVIPASWFFGHHFQSRCSLHVWDIRHPEAGDTSKLSCRSPVLAAFSRFFILTLFSSRQTEFSLLTSCVLGELSLFCLLSVTTVTHLLTGVLVSNHEFVVYERQSR